MNRITISILVSLFLIITGCNRQKQEQKNTEQSVHPAQEEVVKNEPADAETFEEVSPEEIARLNDTIKTQKLNTGEQIMQAYAPKEVSAEGNYSYTVSEASLSGTLKQITLTEEGLPDDSVAARKIIIIADYSTGSAVIGTIMKNHRCRPGRGHETFDSAPCL